MEVFNKCIEIKEDIKKEKGKVGNRMRMGVLKKERGERAMAAD